MEIICSSEGVNISGFERHFHTSYELVATSDGGCTTVFDSCEFEMHKGSVLLIPPLASHYLKSAGLFSDVYVQFDFSPIQTNTPLLFYDYSLSVMNLVKILKNTYVKKEGDYQRICLGLLHSVFDFISELKRENHRYDFIPELKRAIEHNISNTGFSLTKEIRETGYNADYVRRCFKEETGMTPYAYLTHLRMDLAKRLLSHSGNSSVKDIAIQCGYADQYYFSRVFSKSAGRSPIKYRMDLQMPTK